MKKHLKPLKLTPLNFAQDGRISEINWSKLTPEDIKETDPLGRTLLHYAAHEGYWGALPEKLRDKKYWTKSKDGDTVYISAYYGKRQDWINKEELTEEDLIEKNQEGFSIALLAARDSKFNDFPHRIVTQRVLLDVLGVDDGEDVGDGEERIIHQLARYEQFYAIPKEILTEEVLSLRGYKNEAVYHLIASGGKMKHLSKELITKPALLLKTKDGTMTLHYLARLEPDLIPEDITLKELLAVDDKGDSPLQYWAMSRGWMNIPQKFLTRKSLDVGKKGYSVLEYIADHIRNLYPNRHLRNINKEEVLGYFKNILSKASSNGLERLVKDKHKIVSGLARLESNKRAAIKKLSRRSLNLEF